MRPVPFDFVPLTDKPVDKESQKLLKEGCQFIRKLGQKIGYPNRTILTSQLYFRKFYLNRSLMDYPHLDIALTAIILGSKAEETFKKIKSVLVAAFLVLNPAFKGREEDIIISEEHRLRVVQYERELLISVGFNFNILHAHSLLLEISTTSDFGLKEEDIEAAWQRLNSIYEESDFALQVPAHLLAIWSIPRKSNKEIEVWLRRHDLYFENIEKLWILIDSRFK